MTNKKNTIQMLSDIEQAFELLIKASKDLEELIQDVDAEDFFTGKISVKLDGADYVYISDYVERALEILDLHGFGMPFERKKLKSVK